MIQPLRTVHRRVWYGLALLLPAILVAGLLARPHRHTGEVAGPNAKLKPTYTSAHAWAKLPIQTHYFLDAGVTGPAIGFDAPQGLNLADPLLYWSPSLPGSDTLPADAALLGEFAAGKTYSLPSAAAPGTHLILYSLAQKKVIDTATLEKIP